MNRFLLPLKTFSIALFASFCLQSCHIDKAEDPLTPSPEDPPSPSPYISEIFDFCPAPGQFINSLPSYSEGDSKEEMILKVSENIVGVKNGTLISLGGYGGYVVFGFDHTIENVEGMMDFRVMGNAFWASSNPNAEASSRGGSCEPGIIMVAYDANGNGVPDDEWYEIAGSEYSKNTTIKGYQITYYKPTTETRDENPPAYTLIENYIKWSDNQGGEGYIPKNTFHTQSYYPSWIQEDTMTFTGTLLPDNGVDESGNGTYYVLYSYAYGYADNAPNTDDASAIDIGWAVDSQGNSVDLPGINFVKVYCGINQVCGWIGETSTEVAGAYDLHLCGEEIESILPL